MNCVPSGMPTITSFRDLIAWQKAMKRFGLAHQMRKSAVSVPSNIAEGTRHATSGYAHHVVIALGSHAELGTQCELAARRHFITSQEWAGLAPALAEVGRLTHGLLNALRRNP